MREPVAAGAWLDEARARVARAPLAPEAEALGRVLRNADGMAHVSGLPDLRLNELLRFEGGQQGFALALTPEAVEVALLDPGEGIGAGGAVRAVGELLSVPVGPSLLGRVIDPLGRPLDGGPPLTVAPRRVVERPAPAVIERAAVAEPLATGLLAVDALFAIGRGQRELIIGDRATGKTSLAVDAMLNQHESGVVSIYVAVGQRATAVQRVIEALRQRGTADRCVIVVASPATPPGLQWMAPFAGMTIAEEIRDRGGHALIVLDDLTKHAATHRELALLGREPPGREAYPGDIFYVHARLLERAACLAPERGGGSLTALPIAETDAGNLSAYIPTNLISITDGQIVLDQRLFAANQRPAVDIGLSVSRVGGKAQPPVLRQLAGRLRLDYAQFLELEMFTRFGGISDNRVRGQITRGQRIRALLAQPRFASLRPLDQVALLAALDAGLLDQWPATLIAPLRQQLPDWLDSTLPRAAEALGSGRTLEEPLRGRLLAAVKALGERLLAEAKTP
jgi:F-type H+-transporting ATPase subunit alpha